MNYRKNMFRNRKNDCNNEAMDVIIKINLKNRLQVNHLLNLNVCSCEFFN